MLTGTSRTGIDVLYQRCLWVYWHSGEEKGQLQSSQCGTAILNVFVDSSLSVTALRTNEDIAIAATTSSTDFFAKPRQLQYHTNPVHVHAK
jgi:hypothetical protein